MTLEEWKSLFEQAMLAKIADIKSFRKLKILDVGVFPWNASIEISVFYVGDDSFDSCFEGDVASWPGYDFSGGAEGRWPEAESLCEAMNKDYETDTTSKGKYFQAVADVMKQSAIIDALNTKLLDDNFRVTILDPDDPDTDYM
ncbi:MAG: hypothetical protein AAGA75_06630 [Cyanobacteria bacterium P01_E01_bin.6]